MVILVLGLSMRHYILISRASSRNSTDVPAVSVATKLKVYVMILKKINIQSTLVICL